MTKVFYIISLILLVLNSIALSHDIICGNVPNAILNAFAVFFLAISLESQINREKDLN